MSGSIPRFLLPQRSAIWQTKLISSNQLQIIRRTTIRNASQKVPASKASPSKPLVLEKPAKFNPPSHGSKLKSARPKSYGAPLSEEQVHAQQNKQYPNMMPPEGSFLHWFLTSRWIHVWITLGTLLSLAAFTWIEHFRRTSPVAHLLPPASDLLTSPISFIRTTLDVYRIHVETRAAATYDHRLNKVLDVGKRHEFRKAHGMPGEGTFMGWSARTDAETLGPGLLTGDSIPPQPGQIVRANWKEGDKAAEEVRRKAPKWFGIW